MARPDEFGSLQTGEWGRIQELADRFERACQQAQAAGTAVDLNALLPGREDPLRRVALYELIKIDMEFRWRRGQIITLEHYLEAYPELGKPEELSPRLIYEEYRLSQLNGVNTSMSVYNKRFPKQFEEVQKLIHEGNAMTRMPNEAPPSTPPPSSGGPPVGSGLASANPLASGQDAGMIVGAGYKLERKIGSGAFGEVWRGKSRGGVEVAVKIIFRPLDNEEAKSELTAMELIRTLRHPFLLQTHDFWPEQDRLFIVMELADGSLRDRLKACKKLGMTGIPAKELLTYFHQAAEAIDYLHSKRLLHRDIKPDNILLQEQYAKVADFGLARLMSTRRSAKMSGSGTPAYMAPEMWSSQVNQFSDQYCLATSYAELRQGKALFQGQDIIQLMRAHLQEQPNLSGLAPQEKEVVLRALDKVCEKRFGTCGEFVAALDEVVDTGKVVRRDVPHAAADAPQRPTLAPHTGLIHDEWPDDQAGTLRPGATGSPVFAPALELQPRPPKTDDTDSREMQTVPVVSEHALPSAPSVRPGQDMPPAHPVLNTPRPPSWRSTDRAPSPTETEAAPAPQPASIRNVSWRGATAGMDRRKKKLLLGVGAGVALLALIGFLFLHAGSSLHTDTENLAVAGHFDEALQHIDQASLLVLPSARASARSQVQALWRKHLSLIHDSDNYNELEKAAEALLKRFPDDDKAAALLDSALKHNIPPLIDKGEFGSAFERLAVVSPKSKEKEVLIEKLHTQWLGRAGKELAAKAYKEAEDTALKLLLYFKNDPAAEGLRRKARFQIVAIDVRKLQKDENFDAALARLNAEARDLDPDAVATLKHDVEHARHDKFHFLVEKAQEDLDGKKIQQCLAKLTEAEKLASDETDRATIRKWRIKAGSGPVGPLLDRAEHEFAKEDFADCQKTARLGLARLNEVQELARQDVKQKLDTYLVLAWARDPDRDAKLDNEMQGRFTHLFDQGSSPRLGELSRTYLELAKKLPRWRSQAQILRGVLAKLAPADRTVVERELDAFGKAPPAAMSSAQLVQARTLYDKGDYPAAEDVLRRIDPEDLTDAAARNESRALRALTAAALKQPQAPRLLMEALGDSATVRKEQLCLALAKQALEQPASSPGAVPLLAKLLPELPPTPDKAKADCYVAYLSGLSHRDADQFEAAAKDMLRAYAQPTDALATPDRAGAAADVLTRAAEVLPQGDDPLVPFPNRADADKVYQWLEKAQTLRAAQKKELPVAARVKLALAANFKTEPDRKLARDLADQLVTKDGQAELPLLVVRAQAQEDRERAVAAYADILKQFKKKQSRSGVSPKAWFDVILQPAVTLGYGIRDAKEKSPEVKADLARCYASYARFVREHLFEDWTPKNPKQLAFDSYSKAVALDDTNPEYWIGRAYCGTALTKVDWTEVKQDTDQALKLGPNRAAAYGLLGYVELLQSRRDGEADRKKQLAELKEADKALAKAMQLAKTDEEDKATVRLNRSIVCVELGNYVTSKEEQKKYLYAARDYAAQTADLSPAYPELVQEAWGNALEDIAYFLGETDAYPQAVKKFTAAISLRQLRARTWVGRGRTEYRWAVSGKNKDAKVLTNAMSDLGTAINLSPLSRDAAEAYYWEGMIFQARHKATEARKAFAKAIDIGKKYNGRDWVTLARHQNVRASLAAARALLQKQPAEAIKQADEAAQLVEQDRTAYTPAEAARLLIEIYRLKADAGLQQAAHAKGGEALSKAEAVVEAAAAKIQENGDLPQAALVRGLALEYSNKLTAAIRAYSEGLADYPKNATPIHGQLLLNRTRLLLNTKGDRSREQMLKDLQAAVKLVPDDAEKASALALIALIHTQLALAPGGSLEERMEAINADREAIKKASKTHPDWAGIRYLLVVNLSFVANNTPADKDKLPYLKEGIERAREALQRENMLDPNIRVQLREYYTSLQSQKMAVEERLGAGG